MRKILIVSHNYPQGPKDRENAGIFVHDLARELVRQKASVHVVCPGPKSYLKKFDEVNVHYFKWNKNKKLGKLELWNPLSYLQALSFFNNGLKTANMVAQKESPDICLAMWALPSGVFTYFLRLKLGIPYAVWALGSDIYIYAKIPVIGFFIKQTLKSAKYLFADGIDLSRKVQQISTKRCLFLPSASSFVSKKNIGKKNNSRKVVLTFIGRMEPVKGPDIFMAALDMVKGEDRNLLVHYIGDGSLSGRLKQIARRSDMSPKIIFHGNVLDKQKAKILKKTNWVIIPSRSDSIPLVFSEAMKFNIPVVVSDLPDLEYLIKKYRVGLVFKYENVSELAGIIRRLSEKKENYKLYKKNTHKVSKMFSIEKSARELLKQIIK